MGKRLVIVESPAKARTIAGYLGSDFAVESSIGHVRDLPEPRLGRAGGAAQALRRPRRRRRTRSFEPYYVVDAEKKKVVTELKKHLKDADELLLATDEDREGEAIAWHLVEVLKPKVPVRRMVFHEITREAIARALEDTRDIDQRLVDAQETRRILDRLYGYEVSPVLWKKVTRGLSAGRVQSVATRLVVERERERIAFVSAELLGPRWRPSTRARSRLASCPSTGSVSRRAATSRPDATLREEELVRLDEAGSARARGTARGCRVQRSGARRRSRTGVAPPHRSGRRRCSRRRAGSSASPRRRRCASRSGCTSPATSRTCGRTRRRCPSRRSQPPARRCASSSATTTSPRSRARTVARSRTPRRPTRRSAQRETRSGRRTRSKRELSRDEHALYDLIWKRTLASQMEDARGQTVSLRIGASSSHGRGRRVRRLGHRASPSAASSPPTSPAGTSPPRTTRSDASRSWPSGRRSRSLTLEPEGHSTSAAAALHGADARQGARGSWHRPAVDVRGDPLDHRRSRLRLQEGHRARPDLPRVRGREPPRAPLRAARRLRLHGADGGRPRPNRVRRRGPGRVARALLLRQTATGRGLHHLVTEHLDEIDARAVNSIAIPGTDAVVRVGRYGPYLERGDAACEPAGRPRSRRADRGEGGRSCSRSPTAGRWASTPARGTSSSCAPGATARTSPRSSPTAPRRSRAPPRCFPRCRRRP